MTVASSVAFYLRFFQQSDVRTVLDYGAGTLRNAVYLLDHGFTVYAADLPEQVKALQQHPALPRLARLLEVGELERTRLEVDLVISTYVFNIIHEESQRRRYLENVTANLRPGGYLLLEECCLRDHADGGSGVPNYTHLQLDALLAPYGFRRLCHYYRHESMAVIYSYSYEEPSRVSVTP